MSSDTPGSRTFMNESRDNAASQSIHSAHARIRIVVDDREANSGMVEVLKETEGVDVTIRHLSLGDYEVDGRLLFERKTLLDLVVSIKDGRLFRQACRLVSNPLRSAIILEGNAGELASSGMRREAIQGALITLTLILGIPLLRSKEPRESARLMLYAARQVQSMARGALPRKVKRSLG